VSDTVISWDDLTKGYGSMVAVDAVSFEVGRAEILAAGRNGVDTTTLSSAGRSCAGPTRSVVGAGP
jgi:ABC-type branched-subunit amino acid transport system ATPase component